MKVTVIGKYGPYAKEGNHAASCYLVNSGKTNLVLDMGPGTLSRLREVIDVREISAIFISHLHYDHTSDLLCFRYLLEDLNDHKVTIYTQLEDSPWCKLLFDHPDFNVIGVTSKSKIQVGDLSLSFYDMKHTVPCLAVKINDGERTLAYTGDTLYNENIPSLIDGADAVVMDCSKPLGFKGPHMNVGIAKEIHEKTGVRIISSHLSPDYDPTEEYKNIHGIETAEEMKTYEI